MINVDRRHFGKLLLYSPIGALVTGNSAAQEEAVTKGEGQMARAARLSAVRNDVSYLNFRRFGKMEYSMLNKQGALEISTQGLVDKRKNTVNGTEPNSCLREQPYRSQADHEEAVSAEFVSYLSTEDFGGRVRSDWAGWVLHVSDAIGAWAGRDCEKASQECTNRLTYVSSNIVKREVSSPYGIALYCGFRGQPYVGETGDYTLRLYDDQNNQLIDAFEFSSTKFTFWLPLTTQYGDEFSPGRRLRAEISVSMEVSRASPGTEPTVASGRFYFGFLHEVERVCR